MTVAPILHISGFFETHRDEYYSSLQAVRESGAIEEWVLFFAEAVRVQADESSARIKSLVEIRERYRKEVFSERSGLPALVDVIFKNPVLSVTAVMKALGVAQPTASSLLRKAESRGWLNSLGRWGRGGKERWLAHEVWQAVASSIDKDAGAGR